MECQNTQNIDQNIGYKIVFSLKTKYMCMCVRSIIDLALTLY